MRLYFALVAGALVIAAICGAALSWDGSYYLFETLDSQTPYVPHDRLSDLLLNWPALAASRFTADFTIIRLVFNLAYAVVPLAALAASWLIVRKTAPSLFVWAALAIGLGTLPGQFSLIGEGIQVAQLGWPVLLATLLRLPRRHIPLVVVFVALVFVEHPTGSAVLGFSALIAAIIGLRYREDRWKMWGWACGLAILGVVRFLRLYGDSYETGQLSLSLQVDHFHSSVAGMPLYALLFAWSAALVIFLSHFGDPIVNRAFARTLEVYGGPDNHDLEARTSRVKIISIFFRVYGYLGVLAAGLILLVWASSPHAWKGELDYKGLVLACCLPFMLFAAIEGILGHATVSDQPGRGLSAYRRGVILLSGAVFLAVFGTQSLVFAHITSELQQDIRNDTSGCIPIYGEPALNDTLFTHWSVSSLAMVLQSRKPHTVVLDTFSCDAFRHAGRVQLISWDPYSYITHWFDLGLVRARLAVPTASPISSPAKPPSRSASTLLAGAAVPSKVGSPRPTMTPSPTRSATVSPRPTSTSPPTSTPTASPVSRATALPSATGAALSRLGLSPSWLPSMHVTQACRFQPAQGWYAPERVITGSWRWSSGIGYIRVTAAHAMRVVLNVGLVSAMPRDTVNLVLNGTRVSTAAIAAAAPAPIRPVTLSLRAGDNLLVLRSVRPATILPGDTRPLAMAAVDLTLSVTSTGPACASPEFDLARPTDTVDSSPRRCRLDHPLDPGR